MNSQKIIELLLDKAFLYDDCFYHPSFRKGFRKMFYSNISFQSAKRKLSNTETPVKFENGKYFVISK